MRVAVVSSCPFSSALGVLQCHSLKWAAIKHCLLSWPSSPSIGCGGAHTVDLLMHMAWLASDVVSSFHIVFAMFLQAGERQKLCPERAWADLPGERVSILQGCEQGAPERPVLCEALGPLLEDWQRIGVGIYLSALVAGPEGGRTRKLGGAAGGVVLLAYTGDLLLLASLRESATSVRAIRLGSQRLGPVASMVFVGAQLRGEAGRPYSPSQASGRSPACSRVRQCRMARANRIHQHSVGESGPHGTSHAAR